MPTVLHASTPLASAPLAPMAYNKHPALYFTLLGPELRWSRPGSDQTKFPQNGLREQQDCKQ
eukprot:8589727-Alexandrium_andersonii.AAC.1